MAAAPHVASSFAITFPFLLPSSLAHFYLGAVSCRLLSELLCGVPLLPLLGLMSPLAMLSGHREVKVFTQKSPLTKYWIWDSSPRARSPLSSLDLKSGAACGDPWPPAPIPSMSPNPRCQSLNQC